MVPGLRSEGRRVSDGIRRARVIGRPAGTSCTPPWITFDGDTLFVTKPDRLARSTADLLKKLTRAADRLADPACKQIRDAAGVYFADAPLYTQGTLALLFPGEGAQYSGMLADLCGVFPEVEDTFAWCDRIAALPEHALTMTKPLLRAASDGTWENTLAMEEFAEPQCFTTEVFQDSNWDFEGPILKLESSEIAPAFANTEVRRNDLNRAVRPPSQDGIEILIDGDAKYSATVFLIVGRQVGATASEANPHWTAYYEHRLSHRGAAQIRNPNAALRLPAYGQRQKTGEAKSTRFAVIGRCHTANKG